VKFTNVRELKAKTSEMLRTVERGNTVLVTTHGRPTAMLVPVTEDDIEDALLAYSPKLRRKIEARQCPCPTTRQSGSEKRSEARDLPGLSLRESST
jgi:prevent-host-death family protein